MAGSRSSATHASARLRQRADPASWRDDEADYPPDLEPPANAWETAAAFGARVLADRIVALGADTALAGAGVANLATWLGVRTARAGGSSCVLCAELGLWGYEPTPADPFVFNHRAFPSATMLADSSEILGMVMPGPGTTSVACLGAAIIDVEPATSTPPRSRAGRSSSGRAAGTTSPRWPTTSWW